MAFDKIAHVPQQPAGVEAEATIRAISISSVSFSSAVGKDLFYLLINHLDANASLMPLKLLSEIWKFISLAASLDAAGPSIPFLSDYMPSPPLLPFPIVLFGLMSATGPVYS
ncbi:hypothetical protein ACLKA7_007108 [Drosophila subpalustris]